MLMLNVQYDFLLYEPSLVEISSEFSEWMLGMLYDEVPVKNTEPS